MRSIAVNTDVEKTQTNEAVLMGEALLVVEPDAKIRQQNKLMTTVSERERVYAFIKQVPC